MLEIGIETTIKFTWRVLLCFIVVHVLADIQNHDWFYWTWLEWQLVFQCFPKKKQS